MLAGAGEELAVPTYLFHAIGRCVLAGADYQRDLPDIQEARREAKRFARSIFERHRIANRVEVRELGSNLALIIPANEDIWLDARDGLGPVST
jgi:hypothetical protein